MGKKSEFPFEIETWMGDPAVTRCSPATRGIWFDFLCRMYSEGQRGVLTGTRDELALLGRCQFAQLESALQELRHTKTADVSERGDQVTIVNRRMQREYEKRVDGAKRVRKHRSVKRTCNNGQKTRKAAPRTTMQKPVETCNNDVTPLKHDTPHSPPTPPSLPPKNLSLTGESKSPPRADLEIGGKPIHELVDLKPAELDALVKIYGEQRVVKAVEDMGDHKGATGTRYQSDYYRLNRWCRDNLAREIDERKRNPDPPEEPREPVY